MLNTLPPLGSYLMTPEAIQSEHDRLYKAAVAAVYPLIEIHGKPLLALQPSQERELRRGLGLFDQVLQINPQNWASMWFVGKAYQRLRNLESAFKWFSQAHEVNPEHPDISREAAIVAMDLDRPLDAISFCERAIKAKPNDAGLRANLCAGNSIFGRCQTGRIACICRARKRPGGPNHRSHPRNLSRGA